MLCTPKSFYHRMLRAESARDVQHVIYDEVHDASPWTLFLLSHHLNKLSKGARCIKIYLMTATPDTAIFKAVQEAVAVALPESDILGVAVPPAPGAEQRLRSSTEIPRKSLPKNFDQLSWQNQTCACIKAITSWAPTRHMSAAILVLVPGEQEMQQVITSWLSATAHEKKTVPNLLGESGPRHPLGRPFAPRTGSRRTKVQMLEFADEHSANLSGRY